MSSQSPVEQAALAQRTLTFLGFSRNESVCAWRQTIRRSVGTRWVEVSSTALLIRLADNHILAMYRERAPHRTTREGRFVHTDAAAMLRRAPEYAQALPAAQWFRLRQKAQFATLQAEFKDATIRLEADADSHLHLEAKNGILHVTGEPNGPLGFETIARLINGDLLPLGRFRVAAYSNTVQRAELNVYYSHSGHSIAVLVHFLGPQVPLNEAIRATMVQHQESPLASYHIGVRARAWQDGQSIKEMFEEMHPEGKKDWQDNVGTLF